jgi:hypothetical protein
MAGDIGEDKDGSKAVVDLTAQLNAARKVAAEVASGTDQQNEVLASLSARVNEIQARVSRALESATASSAVIENLRGRGEVALKQIEDDTRKANSESGFAFNAKGNAEEHAKAIAQIRGTVEATFSGLTATKANTDALEQSIVATRAAAELAAKSIEDTKIAVTQGAAQVTAASERVAAILPSIEQGSRDANVITAAKAGAEANAAAIQLLQTQMAEVTAKTVSEAAAVARADEDCKTLVASMSEARTRAMEANSRLDTYEQDIQKMSADFTQMQAKLEGLLPHATSAGLASAFHNQKARFSKPQPWWLGLFVVTIIALLGAAGIGLPAAGDTWDAILRHFVNRLPIVAPLVWLAIYAGHHYSMALRMEEDYAFKEAVSTAFEGYKREMLAIPPSPGNDVSPLVILCENVLRAVAERPGRIYDGKTDVVTPLTPAVSAVKDMVAELLKRKDEKP